MKKFVIAFICLLNIVFINVNAFSADYSEVNKKTAIRCLKLAENCLIAQDWQNALGQAQLGLSYDDSISDLIYVQAASLINLNYPKKQVLDIIIKAFEQDNWVDYTKNGARILLADLLSDTGENTSSNLVLDEEPFLYSADAEFIRIKNYYRLSTEQSISQARTRVNSARRIYPKDSRFDSIFFYFESLLQTVTVISGQSYEIPEIVQNITDSYVAKLPDYNNTNDEIEILACCFARPEIKTRLIRAILAKENYNQPLLPILALENQILTQEKAVELFFNIVGNSIPLHTLERLLFSISDEQVLFSVAERMNTFNGKLLLDSDYDLQTELEIIYENGRPQTLHLDENNDGIEDLYVSCDFGSPQNIYYPEKKIQFFYSSYPYVSKIMLEEQSASFNFLHNDYSFSPVLFLVEPFLSLVNLNFYIPYISSNVEFPSTKEMAQVASSVELACQERNNATVNYTIYNGQVVLVRFFENQLENQKEYAYCDFESGLPLQRYVDYDNDGFFETVETFDVMDINNNFELSLGDKQFIYNIFGDILATQNLYLNKVQIDRNANTFYEYEQLFTEKQGYIINWDYDDNGVIDCTFVQEPLEQDNTKNTNTTFYDAQGNEIIKLFCTDDIPVKMDYNGQEVIIYAGSNDSLYWIEQEGNEELENLVLKRISMGLEQGVITNIALEDDSNKKISIIKVDSKYFCKLVDSLTVEEILND